MKRYSVRKCGPNLARLAMESHPDLDPAVKPEIWRFSPSGWNLLSSLDEAAIGRSGGPPCALVCWVRRGDVLGVREILASREAIWSYYQIGPHFEPVCLVPEDRRPNRAYGDILRAVNEPEPLPDRSEETEIRRFFAQRHPGWLQEIVDRQIDHWRATNPDRFFRFAPEALSERGIDRCVGEAPFAALARFRPLLSEAQLEECVVRSPRGAVIHALDQVPPELRTGYLIDHAPEALRFSHHHLSDEELATCAWIDVRTGFHLRTRLSPQRRAIALAGSYSYNFLESGETLAELHREITRSLVEFPEQWKASDRGGFDSIFSNLGNKIGWKPDVVLIAQFMAEIASEGPCSLRDYLAGAI